VLLDTQTELDKELNNAYNLIDQLLQENRKLQSDFNFYESVKTEFIKKNQEQANLARENYDDLITQKEESSASIQTVVCNLSGGPTHKGITTIALLDSGSNQTLIDRDTAVKLRLKRTSKKHTMVVSVFDSQLKIHTHSVEVYLTSVDGLVKQYLTAYAVKNLVKHHKIVDWSKEKTKFSHLKSVPFEPLPQEESITILVGSDYSSLLGSSETRTGTTDQPLARRTPLGWICSGPLREKTVATKTEK
jgi:hypothetical protein